jgi:hypothetical protein
MRKAIILRATGHKSFAVKFSHFPGVVEIHCNDVEVGDHLEFSKEMRLLICHQVANKQKLQDVKSGVDVDIELGQYCVNVRAFVSCKLRYPSTVTEDAFDHALDDSTDNHQFHADDIHGLIYTPPVEVEDNNQFPMDDVDGRVDIPHGEDAVTAWDSGVAGDITGSISDRLTVL